MRQRGILATSTGVLILANVIFFLIAIVIGFFSDASCTGTVCSNIAIQPKGIIEEYKVWTFLTSMFMHGGFNHLLFNMITLMFIGSFVERLVGKKRFLSLYFLGGLIASLTFVILAYFFGTTDVGIKLFSSPETFAVGASGAIFALGGLLAVLTPKMKVLVMFIIPMPMWMAMIGLVFVIWAISLGLPLGVGNTAHFGGLMSGIIYGFYLRRKYPRKTRMISRYFE